jgi:hypothetical protein
LDEQQQLSFVNGKRRRRKGVENKDRIATLGRILAGLAGWANVGLVVGTLLFSWTCSNLS